MLSPEKNCGTLQGLEAVAENWAQGYAEEAVWVWLPVYKFLESQMGCVKGAGHVSEGKEGAGRFYVREQYNLAQGK